MHRRQGDLLEIHPCEFQGHSRHSSLSRHSRHSSLSSLSRHSSHSRHSRDIPDIPVIHDLPAFPGNSTILQVPVSPGNPTHYSILRLECIFYKFYRFYSLIGFHRKLHRVPVEQYKLQTFYKHYILQRKGDVAISVISYQPGCQDDIFSRIELFPSNVLSSEKTNCKNDIQ